MKFLQKVIRKPLKAQRTARDLDGACLNFYYTVLTGEPMFLYKKVEGLGPWRAKLFNRQYSVVKNLTHFYARDYKKFFDKMKSLIDKKRAILVTFKSTTSQVNTGHAYTVVRLDSLNNMVVIADPHGKYATKNRYRYIYANEFLENLDEIVISGEKIDLNCY